MHPKPQVCDPSSTSSTDLTSPTFVSVEKVELSLVSGRAQLYSAERLCTVALTDHLELRSSLLDVCVSERGRCDGLEGFSQGTADPGRRRHTPGVAPTK